MVVEDQTLFRDFLTGLLTDKLGFPVVATAGDGVTALELARQHQPDLILLDILIPQLSGIRVARTILDEFPETRIIALSSESDRKTVHQVHQLFLPGFVDKNEAGTDVLTEAIETVLAGKRFFSPSFRQIVRDLRKDPDSFYKILTRREQEVLTLIGGGFSDADVGLQLGLSPSSAQAHRRNILRKLDLHNTPDLISFARHTGFWKDEFARMGLKDKYHLHQ